MVRDVSIPTQILGNMQPSEASKASDYITEILEELEDVHPEVEEPNPDFSDTVPGRKQHIIEGSRKILELYGEAIERPVRDSEGNIRYEYAMGSIYASLGSYNGEWNFEDEELHRLHKAYRYLLLKSDLSTEELNYNPEEYSDDRESNKEGFFVLLEGFWSNRDHLASSLENRY